jgi:hypothetical protein
LLLEHSMLGFSPTGDGLITHGAFCPGGAGPNVCEVIYRWNDPDRSLEVNSRIALEESAEIIGRRGRSALVITSHDGSARSSRRTKER